MYTYDILCRELEQMNHITTECFSIGQSVMGRQLFCLQIGRGEKKVLLNAAHHGLEYITSAVLMRFLKEYSRHFLDDTPFFGRDVNQLYHSVTIYAIPMVNPDGVDIAVNGLDITNPYHRRLISEVGIHSFSKVWQANAAGVDLNHNYDAGWQMVMERPSPSKYGGLYPEDQPETKAVAELIRRIRPDMLLAFHSQGKEIYYDYQGIVGERGKAIADLMAADSGYRPSNPEGTAVFGGCKDWFIQEYHKPGFTVELGKGKNPLPESSIEELYQEGGAIICRALEMC